jgi:hypothetical protein
VNPREGRGRSRCRNQRCRVESFGPTRGDNAPHPSAGPLDNRLALEIDPWDLERRVAEVEAVWCQTPNLMQLVEHEDWVIARAAEMVTDGLSLGVETFLITKLHLFVHLNHRRTRNASTPTTSGSRHSLRGTRRLMKQSRTRPRRLVSASGTDDRGGEDI